MWSRCLPLSSNISSVLAANLLDCLLFTCCSSWAWTVLTVAFNSPVTWPHQHSHSQQHSSEKSHNKLAEQYLSLDKRYYYWELQISTMLGCWNGCWAAFCLRGWFHGITLASTPSSMAVLTPSGHRWETQLVISTFFAIVSDTVQPYNKEQLLSLGVSVIKYWFGTRTVVADKNNNSVTTDSFYSLISFQWSSWWRYKIYVSFAEQWPMWLHV